MRRFLLVVRMAAGQDGRGAELGARLASFLSYTSWNLLHPPSTQPVAAAPKGHAWPKQPDMQRRLQ